MSNILDMSNAAVRPDISRLLADIKELIERDPAAADRILGLLDAKGREDLVSRTLHGIIPTDVGRDTWEGWLDGTLAPPTRLRLADPDAGRRPGASGAYGALREKQDRLEQDCERKRVQLELAEQARNAGQQELIKADRALRRLALTRVTMTWSEQTAGVFAMGPAFTLMRACSGYLRQDLTWEATLDNEARTALATHRKARGETSNEILHKLDLLCGDVPLEIALHQAILAVIRERYSEVEAERERRNQPGSGPLSPLAKRTRRTDEQRRASVRKEAPISDRQDVLNGLAGGDEQG